MVVELKSTTDEDYLVDHVEISIDTLPDQLNDRI